MPRSVSRLSSNLYTICCGEAQRYVIYNASELGNPGDHVPNSWYFRPYPVPLGMDVGSSFHSAEEAEQAARDSDSRREETSDF